MLQFYRFVLVGGVGFFCDFSIFSIFSHIFNIFLAKLISFTIALQVTYCLNKIFTFSKLKPLYWMYILGQIKGFLFNLVVFGLFCYYLDSVTISFVLAAGVTLLFNFYYAKYISFKKN